MDQDQEGQRANQQTKDRYDPRTKQTLRILLYRKAANGKKSENQRNDGGC